MLAKLIIFAALVGVAYSDCLRCICQHESGCRPLPCRMDVGSLSCGYYQIKLPYYEDCGQPGKKSGESTQAAWQRCALDYTCATQCVNNYYARYKRDCTEHGACQAMSRIHNGGPAGCRNKGTEKYWLAIEECCGCQ